MNNCVVWFIGKLFKTKDIPLVVEFILMFHRDKPIDWLLDHLLYVKVCNPEKDAVSIALFINYLLYIFVMIPFQMSLTTLSMHDFLLTVMHGEM